MANGTVFILCTPVALYGSLLQVYLRKGIFMTHNTDPLLQTAVLYSIFVRDHTPEGTFRAVIPDLPRIRALGTDIIWLMPIHPIGQVRRKGSLGSPYAISDYRAVNPEYGSLQDLQDLVDAIHEQGMRCIIDVVYHHTSPDSVLFREHPEYFYKKTDGTPGNRVADWWDIIDLDFSHTGLWEYLTDTLVYWAERVDGFRCDVASLVPAAFWEQARAAVAARKPDCIWLAETSHLSFNLNLRRRGIYTASDTELFRMFDMEYEYDVREVLERYLAGTASLSNWLDVLNFQDFAYPEGYNKLRFLENHDLPRIASLVPDESSLRNFTAMLYFLKGAVLLYAGQERAIRHCPDLFDRDTIDWSAGRDLSSLLTELNRIRKEQLHPDDLFFAEGDDALEIAVCQRDHAQARKIGVFSLRARKGDVSVNAPDGTYTNQIDQTPVQVHGGKLHSEGKPVIIAFPQPSVSA